MPLTFTPLAIPGVFLIEPRVFADDRGFFLENFKQSSFRQLGIDFEIVQENISYSQKGVLRGLHFQNEPYAQAKFVSVLRGEIFDVAVDLRRGSPTFGHWLGEILSAENHRSLFVPRGFAHGFCVLGEEALVSYKVDAEYHPAADRSIRWNDPAIGVTWPIAAHRLSAKDAAAPLLRDSDFNFVHSS